MKLTLLNSQIIKDSRFSMVEKRLSFCKCVIGNLHTGQSNDKRVIASSFKINL